MTQVAKLPLLLSLLAIWICPPSLAAAGSFNFVIPWDDASPSPVSVSSLGDGPAGSHGFIVVKNGHFVESATGKRVRFLAVNMAAADAFPTHDDAQKVAARLEKYGVNLVRLHHTDNDWSQNTTLIDLSYKDRRHIDAAQLDRFDYLIYQLKQHGVYSNINLHIARTFSAADGFPSTVSDIPFGYDKRVDYFDTHMIALEKEYAHDLLTHVNPYTHTSYCNEPAILNAEITNEDSLLGDPWGPGLGTGLDQLPQPFLSELQGLWNKWLEDRYKSAQAVETAWTSGVTVGGENLLKPWHEVGNWYLEQDSPATGTLETTVDSDTPALKATVTQADGADWHVQLMQSGLTLEEGKAYSVSFMARADGARSIGVGSNLDQPDWHGLGLAQTVDLTPAWHKYSFMFTARDTVPGHARISFSLGAATGPVWLADISLQEGVAGPIVGPGQSPAASTIPIPDNAFGRQQSDWLTFLSDTERQFAIGMRAYLKRDLGFKPLVICSQVSFGGLAGERREAAMDFADNHAYWQHPGFPHKPWDPVDWNIPNTSMVLKLGSGDTLSTLAAERIAGMPYTISEYNHPAPNDYQAEAVPLLASFASFQDWDAIYLFDYGAYGSAATTNDRIEGFFGVGSNPAKWAFFPAAALILREGLIPPPTKSRIVDISPYVAGSQAYAYQDTAALYSHLGLGFASAFSQKLAMGVSDSSVLSPARALSPTGGDGVAVSTDDPKTARYVASSPKAAVVVGFVGGQRVQAGDATFTFGSTPNEFASAVLVAQDTRPLSQSSSILLTLADRVQNTEMGWNSTRTSVGNQWGESPTIADAVPVTVSFPTTGDHRVFALDETGHKGSPIPSTFRDGRLSFTLSDSQSTMWYLIEVP